MDTTCAPADIHYPTDFSLINEAREKLDDIVRNKKPGKKAIRKAIGKLLRYVRRNLSAVDRLLAVAGDGHGLSRKHQENLSTIRTFVCNNMCYNIS